MGKLLLIQYRDDLSKDHEAQCFLDKSGVHEKDFKVLNSIIDDIPSVDDVMQDVSCVILGGSGQYDLSKRPEKLVSGIEKTSEILDYLVKNDIPTLAVCMGFHIMANKLGCTIEANSEMSENGCLTVSLNDMGKKDDLFFEFPENFLVTQAHKDSITSVSSDTKFSVLGSSNVCPVEVFKYKSNIYGTQFHPELDKEAIIYRWNLYPEYLASKTDDQIREMKAELSETPFSIELLKRFVQKYI